VSVQEVALAHAKTDLGPRAERLRRNALVVGALGLVACGIGAFLTPADFFRAYLVGYLLWVGVALGSLPLMMLHHLSGGAWGLAIRRLLEGASRTLPVLALLFLPLLFGLDDLYVWARPEVVAKDAILQHKAPYLNVPFFVARAVLYFAAWNFLAWRINRWSLAQDETGDVALARRMQLFSGPGILVYAFTITFASFDWVMSLDPHWFSTIFGLLMLAGQGLAAFAFTIAALAALSDREPLASVVDKGVYHDLGKLLLAFVMVWAYFSFSQFLIIYAGNLPEEIPFYIRRLEGGWQVVSLLLLLLHFALPFVLLLSRDLKRNARLLVPVALLVLFMRWVDLHWLVVPNFSPGALSLRWMDVAAPIGIGGVWLFVYLGQLQSRALIPPRDPYLEEAFEHVGHESH
jgi:hypothetical protein